MMLYAAFSLLTWAVLTSAQAVAAEDVSFNRDIRSLLSENCFACHGPDGHARQANLRLDVRDAAVDHGAIVPGDASASLLVERIESDDPDLLMPPPDSGKQLTPEQRSVLKRWIESGAEYQTHWAFVPVPKEIPPPQLPEFEAWPKNDIDRFVAAQFTEHSLRPADAADKGQWLRRVSFDLTGLPPTVDELEAFLNDDSPEAFERVVDGLLASPAYGERMASMWLDVARYADTFGYQSDVEMEVWPWRDWAIRAFNDNLPYDQFVTLQTAGDLLPNATTDQQLATTFNRLHRQTNEGGSVAEEFRTANVADRTTTNGTAFLGLTLECSRCHDHKYDPISQRDFYRLSAYFADIDEFGLYSHFTRAVPTPSLLLYSGDQEAQHKAALAEVAAREVALQEAVASSTAHWQQHADQLIQTLPDPPSPDFHLPLEGDVPGVAGQATRCDGDEQIVVKDPPEFGRSDPLSFSLWVRPAVSQPRMLVLHQSAAAEDSAFRGLQLTLDDGHPEFSLIHFWPGDAVRVQTTQTIAVGEWTHLAVTHDGSGLASGLRIFVNGQAAEQTVERDQLTRDIKHRAEWGDSSVGTVELALGARFRDIGFRDGDVDDLQIFQRTLSMAEVAAIYSAARPDSAAQPDGETIELTDVMRVEHQLLHADDAVRSARDALVAARRNENEFVSGVRAIMTMKPAVVPQKTWVLNRGAYDSRADEVQQGIPEFLPAPLPETNDRLALARWMTDERHPLTSRVIVNRFWHVFFGRGIVASLEDFGSQGVPPSHPDLLDWLARSLMDDGWNLKNLCRRIVLSATYRQSSVPAEPEFFESDALNIRLARGPKHRLSAEQVRDAALFASELLVPKVGGPSVKPYQPAGLWEEAGTGKSYQQATGEGLYRRSLYTFWRRTSPPPSMITFDATSRETCTPRRELTTTPLQALVLMNDPQYVEAARALAELLLIRHPADTDGRWVEAFRRLVSRPPDDAEAKVIARLHKEQLDYFRQHPEDAGTFLHVGERPPNDALPVDDLAATTVVVEALFSYDESMMKR